MWSAYGDLLLWTPTMGHSLEQCASSNIKFDSEPTEVCSGSQNRKNISIDPNICISTVLNFSYDRSIADMLPTGNNIEPDIFEPVEFAGSGLLAIAFVGMSSSDLGIRRKSFDK
ncbi:hypothetical protein HN51_023204 [Arachis hypogaea]